METEMQGVRVKVQDETKRHALLTSSIEVTMEQHLELLASPKKCNKLGVDNTYERLVYSHQHEWYDWPPLPEIDPKEEEDPWLSK